MDDLFVKVFLPVFLFLHLEVAFVWPSLKVWRPAGINLLAFSSEDNAHNYIGKLFKILIGLIIVSVVMFIAGEPAYKYLMPVHYLEVKWVRVTKIVLCFISLLVTMPGHFDMAQSWRIGIDKINEAPLVQTGVFRFSRNPVFVFMIVVLFCILSHTQRNYTFNAGLGLYPYSITGKT